MENKSTTETAEHADWYYELNGQRQGPVSQSEMEQLIKTTVLSRNNLVWRKGFADWKILADSELAIYIDDTIPPPLKTAKPNPLAGLFHRTPQHDNEPPIIQGKVNNVVVWILAFAPLIAEIIRAGIIGVQCDGNEFCIGLRYTANSLWWLAVILNIALSLGDEFLLRRAGVNTKSFKIWVCIVPVYLYQRAMLLNHQLYYFIAWLVSFFLSIVLFSI